MNDHSPPSDSGKKDDDASREREEIPKPTIALSGSNADGGGDGGPDWWEEHLDDSWSMLVAGPGGAEPSK